MNRLMVLAFILTILFSCTKEDELNVDNTVLTGKWKLIEQYSDPGDGSGDFMPVDSQRTIEFFDIGKVVSNGSFCSMSTDIGEESLGVFNESTKTISPTKECYSEYKIHYQLIDGHLQLGYPCIEGCAQKFKKIRD